ncbi:PTS lactose/cellobiose transporter subunit IIA [Lacticaseibacillus casei]|jgi:PTS system cellobiose-specific IIA component|uniref:PTS lactose/cellobiose transporter subunit IIA n=2 Tax=Lacticaseibacillus TaxID=2759736 RepID=A0A5R8M2P9_LACZE|nr:MULTISPECIES: PTS lactose/cellobiose transporter subunit IIA [Lacticaseibacillus]MDG3061226.1 PTS lactose/cellobiose transporter subunit IIA [Lacticaseibacillus sp. BCRC 81376]QVI36100.1 PTS lactose/cellobiose transporter subunit IIA [Lacticaseibacillus casei]QXG60471.1 PTS lactose/cellobiose transporter subunit IIA [Lacticaseibacillus casei]TLF42479.1 PTS lactose/cellobiose transporter subunit IIA [Lacticaseibacillus zeae]WFB37972.1 PTS lactose/cellobiose transporter subunit IIA [Lacticase
MGEKVNEEQETFDRDDLNEISMQVILHAGNARDQLLNILDKLADPTIDEAVIEEDFANAKKELNEAHSKQTTMIQKEAEGEFIPYSVLFVHSQDTLMTVQSELLMTEKMIKIVRSLRDS